MAIKPIKKSKGIVSWPETERPREKLLHSGPESLSDGELLAVLVRIGKKGQSAEDLGRQILTQFNGISGIERAHIEELLSVSGSLEICFALHLAEINKQADIAVKPTRVAEFITLNFIAVGTGVEFKEIFV